MAPPRDRPQRVNALTAPGATKRPTAASSVSHTWVDARKKPAKTWAPKNWSKTPNQQTNHFALNFLRCQAHPNRRASANWTMSLGGFGLKLKKQGRNMIVIGIEAQWLASADHAPKPPPSPLFIRLSDTKWLSCVWFGGMNRQIRLKLSQRFPSVLPRYKYGTWAVDAWAHCQLAFQLWESYLLRSKRPTTLTRNQEWCFLQK